MSDFSPALRPGAFSFPGMVYAITPDQPDSARLLAQVGAALEGGVRIVQYRDKISAMPEKLTRARALVALCHQYGAQLIINDDAVLAIACGADGVHLGGDDGSIREARRLLGPDMIIGASCYDTLPLAQQALADGASYIAFGACFDSPTKPAARRITPSQLAEFRQALGQAPAICGIGGITFTNVNQIGDHVDAIALISELFGSPDHPASPEQVHDRVSQFITEPQTA